jgi:hypothetical protein
MRIYTKPSNLIEWYVDVTDAARLHVPVLHSPSVKLERIFAFAASQNWNDIIRVLRNLRPGNPLIPPIPEDEIQDLSDVLSSKRA